MKYIMTFLWSFLLVSMLNYVVSSVLGAEFNFNNGAFISVIFAVLVFIISAIIPNEANDTVEHH